MKTDQTLASLNEAPLGKNSTYASTYTPSLLFPLSRKPKRDEIGITDRLPFKGYDIWNGFELSWLNMRGKPIVAVVEFRLPCETPNIVESKSIKLYLNSFNNHRFESFEHVRTVVQNDLSKNAGATVDVKLYRLSEVVGKLASFNGYCIDDLDVECTKFMPDNSYLRADGDFVEETLYSDLLKSNCLVTGQPDWGSIQIEYSGKKINHEGLLQYIVSLRDHNEFHEQCVERIFQDINRICQPRWLSVYARYTRRGGLDINPYRTNRDVVAEMSNLRLARQ